VGLTCLVSTSLLTLYFVEDYLSNWGFSLTVVAVCVVSFFLILTDIALLFGVVNGISQCLVPWMALHLAFQVFLFLYFCVKLSALGGYRAVILASFGVLAYFVLVVFLHNKQLTAAALEENQAKKAIDLEGRIVPNGITSAGGDDTFTAIASRDVTGQSVPTVMDDSGEFAVPASATGSGKTFTFPPTATNDVTDGSKPLPEPVEVIEVNKSTNPFLQDIVEQQRKQQTQESSSDDESRECLLAPDEISEASQRNTCELLDIDNKFTPFRPKHKSKEDELPKIKVFLPRGDNDDDDDSDCSSLSSIKKQ